MRKILILIICFMFCLTSCEINIITDSGTKQETEDNQNNGGAEGTPDTGENEETEGAPDTGENEETEGTPDTGENEETEGAPDTGENEETEGTPDTGENEETEGTPGTGENEKTEGAPDTGENEETEGAPDTGENEETEGTPGTGENEETEGAPDTGENEEAGETPDTGGNEGTDNNEENVSSKVKAVWWWNDSLSDEYLYYANENGINTIYYCSSKFNEETNEFIKKANEYQMDVFFLTGDYSWIENRTGLNNFISKFEEYQETHDHKFKGIHLDIEPHQHPEFAGRRVELIGYLIDIAYDLSFKDYDVEYDIPFWLDDVIVRDNIEKKAHQWMIDYADSISIMSYRDSKEAILDVAKDEYIYASGIYKGVIVSVETYSLEGDIVSFYEEGKEYMMSIVNDIYDDEIDGVNGIAIHHIQKWYEMN